MRSKNSKKEEHGLQDVLLSGKKRNLSERTKQFSEFIDRLNSDHSSLYMRQILSPADRVADIYDPVTGGVKKMLMFGSNNYLGLANHPYVKEKIKKAMDHFGAGIGGPPLLNGYTTLHHDLENRLSDLKHAEDTLIFSSGYAANVGLISGLLTENDRMIYDANSHASFVDGLSLSKARSVRFDHNDVDQLNAMLDQQPAHHGDLYVGIEGVYSMDGDIAPLKNIVKVCEKKQAILIMDDAHGTGVLGARGEGTASHFGLEGEVQICMGTFSKSFGMVGGFVSASKPIVRFLRFFARSYMFSASLPPVVIAGVLAGLDVLDREPAWLERLRANISYAGKKFREIGIPVDTQTPIIALKIPQDMNIRKAALRFHEADIFVNSIEYPAVSVHEQRFRISLMSSHTKEDIDRVVDCAEEIWRNYSAGTI